MLGNRGSQGWDNPLSACITIIALSLKLCPLSSVHSPLPSPTCMLLLHHIDHTNPAVRWDYLPQRRSALPSSIRYLWTSVASAFVGDRGGRDELLSDDPVRLNRGQSLRPRIGMAVNSRDDGLLTGAVWGQVSMKNNASNNLQVKQNMAMSSPLSPSFRSPGLPPSWAAVCSRKA
jgi:hypothetical protein